MVSRPAAGAYGLQLEPRGAVNVVRMKIEIDEKSGFCFGVVRAIDMAERELSKRGQLLCLGDIVHNGEEVMRLERRGLQTIQYPELDSHAGRTVLLRAHGEPPSTYEQAQRLGMSVVDATCPVVLALQRKVKERGAALRAEGGAIIIFGKNGHAEVLGLLGQTECDRYVVMTIADLESIAFNRPIDCFSQTTMSPTQYLSVVSAVRERMQRAFGREEVPLQVHATTCAQVSNRKQEIGMFAAAHDAVLFVSGVKSSNGRMLYQECLGVNPRTFFLSSPDEMRIEWLQGVERLGVCGATSTPRWLMEAVARRAAELAEGSYER